MEKVLKAVSQARENGLPKENYWLYFKKNGTAVEASAEENKRNGYLGFFVEDDSRLATIANIAEKKAKWREKQ